MSGTRSTWTGDMRPTSRALRPAPLLATDRPRDLDLVSTLQLITDTIVESLGFEVATINLADADADTMEVVAVSGPESIRRLLLGRRQGYAGWQLLLDASEPWGALRFLDHATAPSDPDDVLSWIPDIPVSDDPDAWHPEDALFAPLVSEEGVHVGMLSVDVPVDGRRPGATTQRALEAFAVTAALAIRHMTLAIESRAGILQFSAVFDSSPVAIALLDQDGLFARLNDSFCRFLGRPREDLLGHDALEFTHPDDLELHLNPPTEKRYLRPDGRVVWGRLHLARLSEDGLTVAQVEDITDRKHAEHRLFQQAHYDGLTGLPNRATTMARLTAAMERDAARDRLTVVFFCDLDRLKLVNDGHGHAVGDAYIREVSRRIRASIRDSDTVGRLSGDEFAVVLEGVRDTEDAIAIAQQVIVDVHAPLRLGGAVFTPSLSLGIACSAGPQITPDELLAQADAAMYRAKVEERGGWHLHDAAVRASALALLELRHDVAEALEKGQLRLHHQPIVRLDDGTVVGHEALLRWEHPRLGLLAPAQFLDVILDSEYEAPVTDWVIAQACRDAATRPPSSRRVAVNISSLQIGRRELPDVVRRALSETGLHPADLVLELTEDRLLSRPDGSEVLARLREVGVSIAIDDFGTGWAGLGYLQRFPAVDIVKLDRSFVAGLGGDRVSDHIVRSVVELAVRCGLSLIVEGVETVEQADLLRALGASHAQGYLFGHPEPLDRRPVVGPADSAPRTSAAPLPARPRANDAERLAALRGSGLLESTARPEHDRLVRLAAHLCDAPLAAITLLDADRLVPLSWHGTPLVESADGGSFCEHAVGQATGTMLVSDTRLDERFAAHPLVTGAPGLRFCAAVPLLSADGEALGVLSVMDVKPRTLSDHQLSGLATLGEALMTRFELDRRLRRTALGVVRSVG